jgi:hypothetical protein
MFFHLVEALEEKTQTTGPEDVLGTVYFELELYRKEKGQFFTPQHISDAMALMACGDQTQSAITEKGYISMCEPCCGSGVMVTSFLKAMQKEELNYCTQLVVTAIDVDLKCAQMTYLQLALYGVPAVVIHGNSITCKEFSRWYTPVYILNGWVWRECCGMTTARCLEDEMIKCALEPTYAAMRTIETLMADSFPDNDAKPAKAVVLVAEATNEQTQLSVGFDAPKTPAATITQTKKPKPVSQVENRQLSLFDIILPHEAEAE